MTKKGSFLAEAAVVLLIMGILLSVTLRTRSFIEASKYRVEATKILELERAWYNYFNLRVAIPPLLNNSANAKAYSSLTFIKSGLLDENDFYSTFNTSGGNIFYGYSQCYSEDNVTTEQYMTFNTNDPDVCITTFDTTRPLQITADPVPIKAKLLCYLESIVDDNDARKGSMLITQGSFPIVNYKGCRMAENAGILSGTHLFGYKIDRSF